MSVRGVRINMYLPTSSDCRGNDKRTLPVKNRAKLVKICGDNIKLLREVRLVKEIPEVTFTPILNKTVATAPMIIRIRL